MLVQTLLATPGWLENSYAVFCMLGGLAVMMYGMKLLGDNLESLAGKNIRNLLGAATKNRVTGVAVGAGVTALVQSSSATTVMLVGFVNVGLMTLEQTAAVIMGANIGSTVTLQIISLKSYFNITAIVSLLAVIGLFINMFSKNSKAKVIGVSLISLGMLFIGLEFMSSSMEIFREQGIFEQFFTNITNPFLLLLVGAVFTAIIQSSAASTALLASLMVAAQGTTGAIPLESAMYAVLGMNIGTCATALLASIGANANAKRTSIIHLLFNVFGVAIFFVIILIAGKYIVKFFELTPKVTTQLANFHTLFNVLTTILLLPFLSVIVKLSRLIIKEPKQKEVVTKLYYLDDRMLETPSVAIQQLHKEIENLANLAKQNLTIAVDSLFDGDTRYEEVEEREKLINTLTKNITEFLVKISSRDISYQDEIYIGSLYHVVSDIERVGDYAENIVEYACEMKEIGQSFSKDAQNEMQEMYQTVIKHFDLSLQVFLNGDEEKLDEVAEIEESIDDLQEKMADKHIERLSKGLCGAEIGANYLSISSHLERIADHMTNIAFSIKKYVKVKPIKKAPQKVTE